MPPNPLGDNVQGCVPEGQSPHQPDGTDEWPELIAGLDPSGNKKTFHLDAFGNVLAIPKKDIIRSSTIGFTGNGQSLTVDCHDGDVVSISAGLDTGICNGKIFLNGSVNGSDFTTVLGSFQTSGIIAYNFDPVITGADIAIIPVNGLKSVKLTTSNWGAGTTNVVVNVAIGSRGQVFSFGVSNAIFLQFPLQPALFNQYIASVGGALAIQAAVPLMWDGSNGVMIYTPSKFHSAQANANGSTALWTPTAGTRFRLMKYMIGVTEDAKQAVAGDFLITLLDGASDIGQQHSVYVPAASLISSGELYTSPWIDLGNGILSASANNVLNIHLPVALTAGQVWAIACGIEQ